MKAVGKVDVPQVRAARARVCAGGGGYRSFCELMCVCVCGVCVCVCVCVCVLREREME